MTNYYINKYLPQKQDLIWIDFEPSLGEEIKGRHPAIVMSSANYSKLTGLVMVMPITHAKNNRLREFFIPLHTKEIEGYINPLQFLRLVFENAGQNLLEKSLVRKIGLAL